MPHATGPYRAVVTLYLPVTAAAGVALPPPWKLFRRLDIVQLSTEPSMFGTFPSFELLTRGRHDGLLQRLLIAIYRPLPFAPICRHALPACASRVHIGFGRHASRFIYYTVLRLPALAFPLMARFELSSWLQVFFSAFSLRVFQKKAAAAPPYAAGVDVVVRAAGFLYFRFWLSILYYFKRKAITGIIFDTLHICLFANFDLNDIDYFLSLFSSYAQISFSFHGFDFSSSFRLSYTYRQPASECWPRRFPHNTDLLFRRGVLNALRYLMPIAFDIDWYIIDIFLWQPYIAIYIHCEINFPHSRF